MKFGWLRFICTSQPTVTCRVEHQS